MLGDGRGSSSRRRQETSALPLLVLRAPDDGPRVAVVANVHGDEVTGLAAVHELDRALQGLLARGTCVLVPSVNVGGLMTQRRVNPDDGLDLNRSFPGDWQADGTARVAGLVWRGLLRFDPTAVIDLHADSAVAVPYAIVDRAIRLQGAARTDMETAMMRLANASGLTVLHEYPDTLYQKYRLDRSLAGAMVNHAEVPAVTLEVGPRRAVASEAVDTMVAAVLRILHDLGAVDLIPERPSPRIAGGPWRRAAAPRVHTAGVFVPRVAPGRPFRAGDVLGEVRSVDGTVQEVMAAPGPGIVVSWTESAWVDERGVPGTLGLVGS